MNVIQEINNVNDKFATKGSKLKIEKRGEKLNIRGSLPSKEEAISMLLGLLQAPLTKLAGTLNEVPSQFVRTLNAVSQSKS